MIFRAPDARGVQRGKDAELRMDVFATRRAYKRVLPLMRRATAARVAVPPHTRAPATVLPARYGHFSTSASPAISINRYLPTQRLLFDVAMPSVYAAAASRVAA